MNPIGVFVTQPNKSPNKRAQTQHWHFKRFISSSAATINFQRVIVIRWRYSGAAYLLDGLLFSFCLLWIKCYSMSEFVIFRFWVLLTRFQCNRFEACVVFASVRIWTIQLSSSCHSIACIVSQYLLIVSDYFGVAARAPHWQHGCRKFGW